jgi:hypothetical protein
LAKDRSRGYFGATLAQYCFSRSTGLCDPGGPGINAMRRNLIAM